MKYLIASIIAVVIIFGFGYFLAWLFLRKRNVKHKWLATAGITIVAGILFILVVSFIYFGIYYHAQDKAMVAMNGNKKVSVSKVDGGWFFDGPADVDAIIFYPGAKVESKAYAPLMLKLAESGFDVFLADMPMNFALFGSSIADKFVKNFEYEHWVIAGHSMGGTMAAHYTNNTSNVFDGLILLASYSKESINDNIKVLSIYGSEDGCLERSVYENSKVYWPGISKEVVINGGNHAQFGDYGFQKGDNTAIITPEEQLETTVKEIVEFFK